MKSQQLALSPVFRHHAREVDVDRSTYRSGFTSFTLLCYLSILHGNNTTSVLDCDRQEMLEASRKLEQLPIELRIRMKHESKIRRVRRNNSAPMQGVASATSLQNRNALHLLAVDVGKRRAGVDNGSALCANRPGGQRDLAVDAANELRLASQIWKCCIVLQRTQRNAFNRCMIT